MPHISQTPLSRSKHAELDDQLFSAFANTDSRNRKLIYAELLTKTERTMLAKRLEMILLIEKGVSTFHISKSLHVSPSTVARFEHAHQDHAYRHTTQWLTKHTFSHHILQLLHDLADVPFAVAKRRRDNLLNNRLVM